jgi:hypothetical protein
MITGSYQSPRQRLRGGAQGACCCSFLVGAPANCPSASSGHRGHQQAPPPCVQAPQQASGPIIAVFVGPGVAVFVSPGVAVFVSFSAVGFVGLRACCQTAR